MNEDRIAGEWKEIKGKVKEKWGKLTDDDLVVVDGRSDQLVGKLQQRYGLAKEAAHKEYTDWSKAHEAAAAAKAVQRTKN